MHQMAKNRIKATAPLIPMDFSACEAPYERLKQHRESA